jgi:hypothetical protein
MPSRAAQEPLWPEAWAMHISVQADTIEHKMNVAAAALSPLSGRHQKSVDAIAGFLNSARYAARRRHKWLRRGVLDRWSGASIEEAFQSLHQAEVFLVELLPSNDIDFLIPGVVARVDACLGPTDPRRQKIEGLLQFKTDLEKRRAGLQRGLEIAHAASDQQHARVRNFRNILLAAAALISVFMLGLVIVVAHSPSSMPLCFHPSITSSLAASGEDNRTVCPSGEDPSSRPVRKSRMPDPSDIEIVAGLGLVGGALGATFAIRKLRGSSTPYDVPTALAFLKVPTGALTAVAGILLLGGGFVPGLSELDSQRQILAYALVFGYAQQLATRLIDERVQSLLQSIPSKDPEADQPKAPMRLMAQDPTTFTPPAPTQDVADEDKEIQPPPSAV